MTPLVAVQSDKTIRTTSRIIAKVFGKNHKDVLKAIDNLECSEKFSRRNFAPRDFTNSRGQTFKEYVITRDGFMFLAMGFTGKKAAEFKELFIEEFNRLEQAVLKSKDNKTDTLWLTVRAQTKAVRHDETDVIKQFATYAEAQGSSGAKWYYKHITNATYKCLQLMQEKKPKLRDTLDHMELANLMVAEGLASRALRRYMDEGEHYKVIYEKVKDDLERFADNLMLPRLTAKCP